MRPAGALLALLTALASTGCFLDRSALGGQLDGGAPPRDGALPREDAAGSDAGPSDSGPVVDSDRDGDGIPDEDDLCPDVPDPDQADLDGDGVGDACDPDRDGDGIPNERDLCPDRDSFGTPDEDGDGIMDDCDACPLDPDPTQPNADGDRLGDACEDEDPTRFSRVAFLATFASTLDGFTASGSVSLGGGSVRVETSGNRTLLRPEDPDHRGNYVVHVRGRYNGPRGTFADGTFAVLLRWNGDRGYGMGLRAEDDVAEISRVDGGGCGWFGGATCIETLASNGASCPDGTDFALRATAFGRALTFDARLGTSRLIQRADDDVYANGGVGLFVEQADVRFDAIAIYAP